MVLNLFLKNYQSVGQWALVMAASFLIHLVAFQTIRINPSLHDNRSNIVKLTYHEIPKTEVKVPEKIEKEKFKNKAPVESDKSQKIPEKIIQGFSKENLAASGTLSTPLGNTLGVSDTGERVKTISPIAADLSSTAKLVNETLATPKYTEEAIDAGIEGTFIVDVFVSVDGKVKQAELRKKINFGMDQRVIDAVLNSKFIPRKNKLGLAEEGWTELKFKLVIP